MTQKQLSLKAETRSVLGRKVKQLRKQGILPGNIFGNQVKSQAVQLQLQEFTRIYNQAGETSIVNLTVNKKTIPVLISHVQLDPVRSTPIHVDFRQVDLTQKVTANIPLVVSGISPAVEEGGVLETPLTEIEVEALPTDLPDQIEIDISDVKNIGDTLTVGDLTIPAKVTVRTDPQTPVVVVSEPKAQEPEEPEPQPEETKTTEEDQTNQPSQETDKSQAESSDQSGGETPESK